MLNLCTRFYIGSYKTLYTTHIHFKLLSISSEIDEYTKVQFICGGDLIR